MNERRPKRKGCRNCRYGKVIRYKHDFPDVLCTVSIGEGVWDGVRHFGDCCEKYQPKKGD